MNIEITTADKLNERDFSRIVKLDTRNWWNVLSAEYGVDKISNFHERMATVYGKEMCRMYERMLQFPTGEVVAYCHELKRPVGAISSLLIQADGINDVPARWHDVTGNGYFTTHKADGNTLVCASIVVLNTGLPSERLSELKKERISEKLIHGQHALAERLGVPCIIAYSRPSNYGEYVRTKGTVPIEDYLKIRGDKGRLFDRSIGMHDRLDAKIVRILPEGRPLDPEALGYNIIMDYSHTLSGNKSRSAASEQYPVCTPVCSQVTRLIPATDRTRFS